MIVYKILTNKYIITILVFIIWMFFFDTNSYFVNRDLNSQIKKNEYKKNTYKQDIKEIIKKLNVIESYDGMVHFAREKYFLKKENEVIYIIEEDTLK